MLLLYASMIENKRSTQSLLRDISRCRKEALFHFCPNVARLPQHCRGTGCAVVQQTCS